MLARCAARPEHQGERVVEHDLHAGHRQHGPHCDGKQPVTLLSVSDSNEYSQLFGIAVYVCAVRIDTVCFYCLSTDLTM